MISSFGVGQDILSNLGRPIRQALRPVDDRHGTARGDEAVPPHTCDMSTPHGRYRGTDIISLSVAQRLGILSKELKGGTKNIIHGRQGDWIGRTRDDFLGPAPESNGSLKVLETLVHGSQPC